MRQRGAGCQKFDGDQKTLREGGRHTLSGAVMAGDPCWNRTNDSLLKSPVSYRLSQRVTLLPTRAPGTSPPRHGTLAPGAHRDRFDGDAALTLDPLQVLARPGRQIAPAPRRAGLRLPAGEC